MKPMPKEAGKIKIGNPVTKADQRAALEQALAIFKAKARTPKRVDLVANFAAKELEKARAESPMTSPVPASSLPQETPHHEGGVTHLTHNQIYRKIYREEKGLPA